MILKKFQGSKINGYLDFDIDFYPELTFLTGINGTGKTSALNAIASLLMPKIEFLATQNYEEISIVLDENGEDVVLSSKRGLDCAEISCSLFPRETLIVPTFRGQNHLILASHEDQEKEYYATFSKKNSPHLIMQFILELPTPMFLGLDRRASVTDTDETKEVANRYLYNLNSITPQKRRRNIFSNSLNTSLNEAIMFAENRIKANTRKKAELDRKFRDDLILELLNFPPFDFEKVMADEEAVDPIKLGSAKENINKIPELIGIAGDQILKRIDNLFEFIEEKRNIMLGPDIPPNEEKPWEDPRLEARFILAHNKANIDKINTLSEMVRKYTASVEEIFFQVHEFITLINSFITDSGKTLTIDDGSSIKYRVGEESQTRDLRTLSSGEI